MKYHPYFDNTKKEAPMQPTNQQNRFSNQPNSGRGIQHYYSTVPNQTRDVEFSTIIPPFQTKPFSQPTNSGRGIYASIPQKPRLDPKGSKLQKNNTPIIPCPEGRGIPPQHK